MMRPRHCLLLLLGLLPVVLAAQPGPPKPARLRFLFLDESPGRYTLKLPSGYRLVSSNPYEISAPFTPADLHPFGVYKALLDPKTHAPRLVKIATVTPPADTPSALVVVTPRPPAAPDAAPVYKVELIDCDPAKFPPGSIQIINRSPDAMAGQFNDRRVVTGPGETSVVQPSPGTHDRILYKIAIQIQNTGGWQLIDDSITAIRPPERMIAILVYSPSGMRNMRTAKAIAELGPPKPGTFWLTFSDSP